MTDGDKRWRLPLIAPAKMPIRAEAQQRSLELALWQKQGRQQREDCRRAHATEADAH